MGKASYIISMTASILRQGYILDVASMIIRSETVVAVAKRAATAFILVCCVGCGEGGALITSEERSMPGYQWLPVRALHIAHDAQPDGIFWRIVGIKRFDSGLYIYDDELFYEAVDYMAANNMEFEDKSQMYGYLFFSSPDYNLVMAALRDSRLEEYGFENDKLCTSDFEHYLILLTSLLQENINHTFSLSDDGSKHCVHWHSEYDEDVAELNRQRLHGAVNAWLDSNGYTLEEEAGLYFADRVMAAEIIEYIEERSIEQAIKRNQSNNVEYIYINNSLLPEVISFAYMGQINKDVASNFGSYYHCSSDIWGKAGMTGEQLINNGIDHVQVNSDSEYCVFWSSNLEDESISPHTRYSN